MASQKISQLTNGNPAQTGDLIPIDRAGANFSVSAASVAALAGGSGSLTGSISLAHNSPTQTAVNLTTDGTYDWAIVSPATGTNGRDDFSNYFRWKANRGMLARNGVRKVAATNNISGTTGGGSTTGGWLFTANAGDEQVDITDNVNIRTIPESSSAGFDAMVDASTGQTGFGFQFVADANATSRTINIYGGGRIGIGSGTITINAHLTDGSAADVTQTFNISTTSTDMWFKTSFTFQSASPCKLLINMLAATATGGGSVLVYFAGMTES